jgi:hypothetical protein
LITNRTYEWINASSVFPVELVNYHYSLGTAVDCTWILEAKEDEKIFLQFYEYALERPNDCTANFVEVYGSKTELEGEEGRIKQFCGSEADSVTSRGNKLHLRFYGGVTKKDENAQDALMMSKFKAYFNVFRDYKEG